MIWACFFPGSEVLVDYKTTERLRNRADLTLQTASTDVKRDNTRSSASYRQRADVKRYPSVCLLQASKQGKRQSTLFALLKRNENANAVMNSLLQGIVCVSLVLVLLLPAAESGPNECRKVYHYLRTKSTPVYYTEWYNVTCGWWQRCTRQRKATYQKYYAEWSPAYRTECCDGWRRDRFGQCAKAICDLSCVHGTCVRPNTCQCQAGFTGSTCSRDIDECHLQSNSVLKCAHMCVNAIGSYRCDCDLGYRLHTDKHTCRDLDECWMTRTHNCEQICTNTPGSFDCSCYDGYSIRGDGATCYATDECASEITCQQLCINIQGTFECACQMGYYIDDNACRDIDECALGEDDCSQTCINVDGTFTCACYDGYVIGMDGKTCYDVDECAPLSMNCDKIRICDVTDQGPVCTYIRGQITEREAKWSHQVRLVGGSFFFEGRVEVFHNGQWGTVCDDNWDINDANVVCRQLHYDGAAKVWMKSHFGRGWGPIHMDEVDCNGNESDLTTCQFHGWGKNDCGHNEDAGVTCLIDNLVTANCTELEVCHQEGIKLKCTCVEEDVHVLSDLTSLNQGDCNNKNPSNPTKMHVCRKYNGTFSCGCAAGYQLIVDNYFCQSEKLLNGTDMRYCTNTPGGFDCSCKEGYTKNIETGDCVDIDECSTDYRNCPDVQICNALNDNLFCECVEGRVNACELGRCSASCTDLEVCVDAACVCYPGYFLNNEGRPCKGGGCGEMIHKCTDTETCNNTIGGYECPCMNGLIRGQGVNATCDDVNECEEHTDGCDHLCMNLFGGYSCTCVESFTLLDDNHTCVMPTALHETFLAYKQNGDTVQNSGGWWIFPLGMVSAFAVVVVVVVVRKISARFRKSTN